MDMSNLAHACLSDACTSGHGCYNKQTIRDLSPAAKGKFFVGGTGLHLVCRLVPKLSAFSLVCWQRPRFAGKRIAMGQMLLDIELLVPISVAAHLNN